MLEDHYRSMWWGMVSETYPQWDKKNEETYDHWQQRVDLWKSSLPIMAAQLMPIFATNLEIDMGGFWYDQDLTYLPKQLLKETTGKGYDEYKKNRDTIYDAIDNAWSELYASQYYPIFKLSGAERTLFEREFKKKYPFPPTLTDISGWIMKNYPNKFTAEQIAQAFGPRPSLTIEERYGYTNTIQDQYAKDIWDVISWAGPNSSALMRKALAAVGGEPNDLSVWYTVGGNPEAWKDKAKFKIFHDSMLQVAKMLKLAPPTDAELKERMEAEKLNDIFETVKISKFGIQSDFYVTLYYQFSDKEQAAWKKANPGLYKTYIEDYYKTREEFAKANQLWAKYYYPDMYKEKETTSTAKTVTTSKTGTSPTTGGGYYSSGGYTGGGRSYGGGGSYSGTTSGTTSDEEGPVKPPFIPLGKRTSLDVMKLLGGIGKGGMGGYPYYPNEFWGELPSSVQNNLSSVIRRGGSISKYSRTYLSKMANTKPQFKSLIDAILAGS
jgi:hypothetical protein